MASRNVRTSLQQASQQIDEICEDTPMASSTEKRLAGIAKQLRYLAEGDPTDPEAPARPDPESLDTIREHLTDVMTEVDEDAATRLERACDEVLFAISVLTDRVEKEHRLREDVERKR